MGSLIEKSENHSKRKQLVLTQFLDTQNWSIYIYNTYIPESVNAMGVFRKPRIFRGRLFFSFRESLGSPISVFVPRLEPVGWGGWLEVKLHFGWEFLGHGLLAKNPES